MARPKQNIGTPSIIHFFALAHAAMAIMSRWLNYYDDVILTVLTISMIVIIAIRGGLKVGIVATITIFGCFLGYILGTYGAFLVRSIIHNGMIAPAITTFLVTECLGWSTYLVAKQAGKPDTHSIRWTPSTLQILSIAVAILMLRLVYTLIFSGPYFIEDGLSTEFQHLFGNTFALIFMLCGNIIYINFIRHRQEKSGDTLGLSVMVVVFVVLFSAVITAVVAYNLPFHTVDDVENIGFFKLYTVVLLSNIIIYPVTSLIHYVFLSRVALRTERNKKHKAQYQYSELKQQVNPHFLFNSLNILDYLVCEHETERASAFIKKLSHIYRYMLKSEDSPLVSLYEEIEFTNMYISLLKERFLDGFTVEFSIPDNLATRQVVPCSVQQLIENASKHNVVSPETPLRITVCAESDYITVTNNLQPKISSLQSTKIGLENISHQYMDMSGKAIAIMVTKDEFCVKLPLL